MGRNQNDQKSTVISGGVFGKCSSAVNFSAPVGLLSIFWWVISAVSPDVIHPPSKQRRKFPHRPRWGISTRRVAVIVSPIRLYCRDTAASPVGLLSVCSACETYHYCCCCCCCSFQGMYFNCSSIILVLTRKSILNW